MALDKIKTDIIDDDAVTGAKIENNPTVAGNLTVTGTSTHTGAVTNSSTSQLTGAVTIGSDGTNWTLPTARSTEDNYVLAMANKNTGVVEWQQTLTAPAITGITGELNTYETPYSITATLADSSTAVSVISATTGLQAGQYISGAGIQAGTTIASVNTGASTLVLSQNTTASASGSLVAIKVQKLPGEKNGGTLSITGTDFGIDASEIDSIKIMKSDGTNPVTASSFGTPTGTGIPNIVFNGSETNYNTFPADTTFYIEVTKAGLVSNKKS